MDSTVNGTPSPVVTLFLSRCWQEAQVYNPEMKGPEALSELVPRASPRDVTDTLSKCWVEYASHYLLLFLFFYRMDKPLVKSKLQLQKQ